MNVLKFLLFLFRTSFNMDINLPFLFNPVGVNPVVTGGGQEENHVLPTLSATILKEGGKEYLFVKSHKGPALASVEHSYIQGSVVNELSSCSAEMASDTATTPNTAFVYQPNVMTTPGDINPPVELSQQPQLLSNNCVILPTGLSDNIASNNLTLPSSTSTPSYTNFTVSTLKKILKARNLKTSGNKNNLIARLDQADRVVALEQRLAEGEKRGKQGLVAAKGMGPWKPIRKIKTSDAPLLDILDSSEEEFSDDAAEEILPSHLEIPILAGEEVDILHTYSEVPDYITEEIVETSIESQVTNKESNKKSHGGQNSSVFDKFQ